MLLKIFSTLTPAFYWTLMETYPEVVHQRMTKIVAEIQVLLFQVPTDRLISVPPCFWSLRIVKYLMKKEKQ